MHKSFFSVLCISLAIVSLPSKADSRNLAVTGGLGTWYGDDTSTSWAFGGGLVLRPGTDYVNLALNYDWQKVEAPASSSSLAGLDGDKLHHWRAGITLPNKIQLFSREGELFGLMQYVLINNASKVAHGAALGGGLEIPLYSDWLGIRFEAMEQLYKIPLKAGGSSRLQADFILNLRLIAKAF